MINSILFFSSLISFFHNEADPISEKQTNYTTVEKNFPAREKMMEVGRELLEDFGGEEITITSHDKIRTLHFSNEDFYPHQNRIYQKWKPLLQKPCNAAIVDTFGINPGARTLQNLFMIPSTLRYQKKSPLVIIYKNNRVPLELDFKEVLHFLFRGHNVVVVEGPELNSKREAGSWAFSAKTVISWALKHYKTFARDLYLYSSDPKIQAASISFAKKVPSANFIFVDGSAKDIKELAKNRFFHGKVIHISTSGASHQDVQLIKEQKEIKNMSLHLVHHPLLQQKTWACHEKIANELSCLLK